MRAEKKNEESTQIKPLDQRLESAKKALFSEMPKQMGLSNVFKERVQDLNKKSD